MPLPVNTASAGSMPSGASGLQAGGGDGTELTSATQPTTGQQAGGGWMPIFQIGAGQAGVASNARGLISGFQSDQTVGQVASNAATTALQNALAANTASGSSAGAAGPSGGAASSNDGSLPADPNINNPGGETAQQNQDYLNSLGSGGG